MRVFGQLLAVLALLLPTAGLKAQTAPRSVTPTAAQALQRGDINSNTLGIVSGGVAGTYIRIAFDLASVLDDGDRMRILPIIGKGSVQNLRDLLYLRGVDLALVQNDTIETFRREGMRNIDAQVRYIAPLYNEEVHIIAANEITDIRQLSGRPVSIDQVGSGSSMTAQNIFNRLGITPVYVNHEISIALEKLRAGEIVAEVVVSGKPIKGFAEFRAEGKFHLLTIPYDERLQDVYLPSKFIPQDYPNLITDGKTLETIAVTSVLAAYNWPENSDRYERVHRFVDAFFSRIEDFHKAPRHPKWQEVNIAANLPGWIRFKAATEWLKRNSEANNQQTPANAEEFGRFLASRSQTAVGATTDRERLFQEFLEWQRTRH